LLIRYVDGELDPETEATIADELRRNLDLQRWLKALRRVEPAYRKTLDEQKRPELWQREREAPQYDLTLDRIWKP